MCSVGEWILLILLILHIAIDSVISNIHREAISVTIIQPEISDDYSHWIGVFQYFPSCNEPSSGKSKIFDLKKINILKYLLKEEAKLEKFQHFKYFFDTFEFLLDSTCPVKNKPK